MRGLMGFPREIHRPDICKIPISLEEGGRKLENRLEAGSLNPTGVGGFSKGQSGNPGGRRKKAAEDIEIQQLARQHGATVIDALVKIAIKGKSRIRSRFRGHCLLDRGFGKATQPVESDVNLVSYGISAVPMTSEERQARITAEIKGKFSH